MRRHTGRKIRDSEVGSMPGIPYQYVDDCGPAIIQCLSPERFETYRSASGEADHVPGLRLYMWNAAVASRFHGPLHLLQVTLRNAVHDRLSANYGDVWYDVPGLLYGPEQKDVASTKSFLQLRREPLTPGKVVAELNFRFWVGLFATKYNPLWKTDLGRLFTPRIDRRELHRDLDILRTLRNRIAHHEPLLQRRLMDDLDRIVRITHALSPHMADWLQWHQRADEAFGRATHDVFAF